jgi:WD40 repeat protein
MNAEEGLTLIEERLRQKNLRHLKRVEEQVFCGSWEGLTYNQIADAINYHPDTVRNVGYHLWQLLSQAFGERVCSQNIRSVLRRWQEEVKQPDRTDCQDWGDAPTEAVFYGRTRELERLTQWLVSDRCKLVTILGMGGVGKTALIVKLVQQIQKEFEYIIWRSLRNSPKIEKILADSIQFLSDQVVALPDTLDDKIDQLLKSLKQHRCLLVLDNLESILQAGTRGAYRPGYEGYGQLIRWVVETSHQSCLVLTSREQPSGFAKWESLTLSLQGLTQTEGQKIFEQKECTVDSEQTLHEVVEHYGGNPLALKIVAANVQEVMGGNLSAILPFLRGGKLHFGDINDLLARQFNRLCAIEQEVMYWLTINRAPVSLSDLKTDAEVVCSTTAGQLPEAIESLVRRSLIEKLRLGLEYVQQPVVMEYVTERLIGQVVEELLSGNLEIFCRFALLKTTLPDYLRESQQRMILEAIAERLSQATTTRQSLHQLFLGRLNQLRTQSQPIGYGAGNLFNLAIQLQLDLRGCDFSHLNIQHGYFKGVHLPGVNLAHSQLHHCVFTQTFGGIMSVAFSSDGQFLATGDNSGQIYLWQMVAERPRLIHIFRHGNWVPDISFAPVLAADDVDGDAPQSQPILLATASTNGTLCLWDVNTGSCLQVLSGHGDIVWRIAWHPKEPVLASGSFDQTVRLWDAQTGACCHILEGAENRILSLAWHPDGHLLAIGSADSTVRLWHLSSQEYQTTLTLEPPASVDSLAWSPDGRWLAIGSRDRRDNLIRLWNLETGWSAQVLRGHAGTIWRLTWMPEEPILASSSHDGTIRLWDMNSFRFLRSLLGHSKTVYSLAVQPHTSVFVSGSEDQTIRLWDSKTGQCQTTLQGYMNQVWSVAWSPDGQTLASSYYDGQVRLWDLSPAGNSPRSLYQRDKTFPIWSVAWSPDGKWLVSGSYSPTLDLWNPETGERLRTFQSRMGLIYAVVWGRDRHTLVVAGDNATLELWNINGDKPDQVLQGHAAPVWSLAWSPDRQTLASASDDQTVKLWDMTSRQCTMTLMHDTPVRSVAFNPDRQLLASGCASGQIWLWDLNTTECLDIWQQPKRANWIWSLAWSWDGQILASGSQDGTLKLWDRDTRTCLRTLCEHSKFVRSVVWCPARSDAFPNSARLLASGSGDETIKIWDGTTGECLKTLRIERPYEGMKIAGVTGITLAQMTALQALGAVES